MLTCMVILAISTNAVISLGMVGALSTLSDSSYDPMDFALSLLAILLGDYAVGLVCSKVGLCGLDCDS